MKKVLIIAYYFPPMGMGGVQRVTKFVKYLPDFGWDPIVLTVKDVIYYAKDEILLDEVKGRTIIRTGSLDPNRIRWKLSRGYASQKTDPEGRRAKESFLEGLNRSITPWLFIPDSKILWLPWAQRSIKKIIHSHQPDIIFTTSPPHSTHLLGRRLKRKIQLPWVADFRDGWLSEGHDQAPSPFHRLLNHWYCQRVISSADRIVAVSEPTARFLASQANRSINDFTVLPNGYDRQDFPDENKETTSDVFTIGYCGALNEILNPQNFLKAIHKVFQTDSGLKKKIQFVFTGSVANINLNRMIDKLNLSDIFYHNGYQSHIRSIQYLLASDLLLLLLPDTSSQGLIPGKLFEYLASGKPILASVPDGETARLVLQHARGVVVPPDDVEGLAREILRCFELWKRNDLKVTMPRWKGIEIYNRRYQAGQLAQCFDQLIT